MRKLKKTLALLLVLVLSLAMVPFAAADDDNGINAAADFTDFADVTQHRDVLIALDVLAATGVVTGHDGGVLDPQTPIIRAEAASIVARVLLGPDVARNLPVGMTGFRDVDGDPYLEVHSGAIAYLHERGIVVGTDSEARLFSPRAQVTGAQVAVMFLRAVGFGVNGEYEGTHFRANAVVDGTRWRILRNDVFDVDHHQPATREMVMFYAYNAMNTRTSDVGLRFVNWSADRQAYVPVMLQGAFPAIGDQLGLETIYRRVFAQSPINLRYSLERDVFGRPADRYTLRGAEIVLRSREAAVTFTTAQPFGVVAALSGLDIGPAGNEVPFFVQGTLEYHVAGSVPPSFPITFTPTVLTFPAWADGQAAAAIPELQRFNTLNRVQGETTVRGITAGLPQIPVPQIPGWGDWWGGQLAGPHLIGGPGDGPLTRSALSSRIATFSGNGVLIEVFVDEATNFINTVTVVRTDIARVTASSPFGITVTPKFVDNAPTELTGGAAAVHTASWLTQGYTAGSAHPYFAALSELSVGDSVLVSPSISSGVWTVGSIAIPESVTGALTGTAPMASLQSTGSLTVGGTVYPRAMILHPAAAHAGRFAVAGASITVLLDTFGNIVYTHVPEVSARDIMFVTGNGMAIVGGRMVPTITGRFPDGTTETINVTARHHIPAWPANVAPLHPDYLAVVGGQGLINAQGATTGAIVQLTGSVASRNWLYAATPELEMDMFGIPTAPAPFSRGPVATANQVLPTLPLTNRTSTIVSLGNAAGNAVVRIAPNQPTLVVGGQHLHFAPDAQYHFFTPNRTVAQGRVPGGSITTMDRNRLVNVANVWNGGPLNGGGFADVSDTWTSVVAVVEQRGFGVLPVITALWIGQDPGLFLPRENLIFLGADTNARQLIDGSWITVQTAFDIGGQGALRARMPEGVNWGQGIRPGESQIFLAAPMGPGFYEVTSVNALGVVTLSRVSDGDSGDLDFALLHGRPTALGAPWLPGTAGTNVADRGVRASSNALLGAVGPTGNWTLPIYGEDLDDTWQVPFTSIFYNASTAIFNLSAFGGVSTNPYLFANTARSHIEQLPVFPPVAGEVRIAAVFHPVTRVATHIFVTWVGAADTLFPPPN